MKFPIAFILFYAWHMLGVTIGYHRLLSHKSFKCPKFVEYFWVLAGYLAFEGSPIWWATMHRAHHRYTDQPQDPHSPRFGWLNAYWGWIFHKRYPAHINPADQSEGSHRRSNLPISGTRWSMGKGAYTRYFTRT